MTQLRQNEITAEVRATLGLNGSLNGGSYQHYNLAVKELMQALDSEYSRGVIHFTDYPTVRIKYDLQSGKIYLQDAKKEKELSPIKFIFEKKSFPFLTGVVADAICLLIKRDLLAGLDSLGDENISWLINKYHRGDKTAGPLTNNLTLAQVDKTLMSIIQFNRRFFLKKFFSKKSVSPLHGLVAELLEQTRLNQFKSQAELQVFFKKLEQASLTFGPF